jgi:CheY-like chemotaxis protein
MNLAVNSRDAMPRGGRFEIKTANVALDASYVAAHSPMNPGAYIKLTVSDTGTGMSVETQSHAFEPFFTTKERGKGTGLGLATVYGIVKQSSGFIWLSSKVGQGATFEIYFPPIAEQLTKPAESRPPAAASKGSETILLVEDEALLRDAICEFLGSIGYTVLAASGGAEAKHICAHHPGKIDLILTDLVMPGLDGVEVANAVSLCYPGITIMYMTGYTNRAAELLDAGAVLLKKPFGLSELASKLRAALIEAN